MLLDKTSWIFGEIIACICPGPSSAAMAGFAVLTISAGPLSCRLPVFQIDEYVGFFIDCFNVCFPYRTGTDFKKGTWPDLLIRLDIHKSLSRSTTMEYFFYKLEPEVSRMSML